VTRRGRVVSSAGVLALILACTLGVTGSRGAQADTAGLSPWLELAAPDQSEWSKSRVVGYARSAAMDLGTPSAVLAIPALALTVPVYDSTEHSVMELGAGWVAGTALPGEHGNVALAGHRDGFFRPLERIEPGTEVLLRTASGTAAYEVAETLIVDPLDVAVLEDTGEPLLTLITCYPFRYVGYAPDRFIVRARLKPTDAPAVGTD